jgi:predicted O-methyltransferase YrrM
MFCNANGLKSLLEQVNPKIVIEVGSWLGASAIFMAEKTASSTKLYTIDTWLGSPELQQNPEFAQLLPDLYQQFLSNVIHANMFNKIIPIRMSSLEAATALNVKADLIYIDADHATESVVADILAWWPHLVADGVLCGDDWGWESVRKALEIVTPQLNLIIKHEDNFWWDTSRLPRKKNNKFLYNNMVNP